jgi:hypothetical protein
MVTYAPKTWEELRNELRDTKADNAKLRQALVYVQETLRQFHDAPAKYREGAVLKTIEDHVRAALSSPEPKQAGEAKDDAEHDCRRWEAGECTGAICQYCGQPWVKLACDCGYDQSCMEFARITDIRCRRGESTPPAGEAKGEKLCPDHCKDGTCGRDFQECSGTNYNVCWPPGINDTTDEEWVRPPEKVRGEAPQANPTGESQPCPECKECRYYRGKGRECYPPFECDGTAEPKPAEKPKCEKCGDDGGWWDEPPAVGWGGGWVSCNCPAGKAGEGGAG